MRYVPLGCTGLPVSRITVGCLAFGDPASGRYPPWAIREDHAEAIIRTALDAGITFFDTANVYSGGLSEEITGRLLNRLVDRADVVIATKVQDRMRPGPYGAGLSRKAVMHEIDASLIRLGTHYVDLYQIHRWDPATPIEETIEALHDVVRAGKALHIGASNTAALQLAKAQYVAVLGGWTRFVSLQTHYNMLFRDAERELVPFCQDQGVGVLAWSPLARGWLAGEWDGPTLRSETDEFGRSLYPDDAKSIIDAVGHVASSRGVSRAQIALAWLLAQPGVTSAIVGATTPSHIDDAVAAVEIVLTGDELEQLEAART